jgi:hypothetical protein
MYEEKISSPFLSQRAEMCLEFGPNESSDLKIELFVRFILLAVGNF